MTFEHYIINLQNFLKENPETKDFKVIAAIDDEGNGFNDVYFPPSIGEYFEGDFMQDIEDEDPRELNAVCVN